MGKPAIPNYTALATQQADLAKQAAIDRAQQNSYTQVSGAGDTNAWTTDPATGMRTNTTTMGARPQAYYNALMDTGTGAVSSFASKYYGGGGAPAGGGGGGGWGGNSYTPTAVGGVDDSGNPVGKGIQKDLDYSGLTAMPTTDPAAARQEAQDALYKRSAGYLDPQWQESQRSTEAQLANQGLTPGTPAYDRAYANLQRAKESAYTGARQDAIAGGGAEAERAQAMALQLRNQGITEAGNLGTFHNAAQEQGANQWLKKYGSDSSANAQIQSAGIGASASMSNNAADNALRTRAQEFNELMQMGEGANQFLPKFTTSQGNVGEYGAPDIYGAAKDQFSNELDLYNAKQKKKGGIMGAVGGIAGAALGSAFPVVGTTLGASLGSSLGSSFSDERLKSNVEHVGRTPGGFNVYDYDIFGHRDRGVMAQEVKKMLPEAVSRDRSGFLKVDYSKVR